MNIDRFATRTEHEETKMYITKKQEKNALQGVKYENVREAREIV